MIEEWKNINGYPDYEVSNLGRVRSSRFDRILKPSINGSGYHYINLVCNKLKKTAAVHRLVAEHFLPQKPENHIIDHVDKNKLNNCVSNLRWLSIQDNTFAYYANHDKKSRIAELRKQGLTIKQIAKEVGLGQSTVQQELLKIGT